MLVSASDYNVFVPSGVICDTAITHFVVLRVGTLKIVLDELDDFTKIVRVIPTLRFKPEWDVQILPSFMGVTARFWINGTVSVYLDYHNRLGIFGGKPYWEIYYGDNPERFAMNDTVTMMEYIESVINSSEKTQKVSS